MNVRMYVCMNVCMYICTYVCIHVHIIAVRGGSSLRPTAVQKEVSLLPH